MTRGKRRLEPRRGAPDARGAGQARKEVATPPARRSGAAIPAAPRRRSVAVVLGTLALVIGYGVWRWSTGDGTLAGRSAAVTSTGATSPRSSASNDIPRVDDLSALDAAVATAIRDAVAAVESEPASGTRWGELGIVYNAHRYYALAERCYAKAQELDPRAPDWPHLRGVLAEERGEVAAAADHYRAALERAPADTAARYRLGNVLLAAGRVDDAERAFADLASAAPAQPWGPLGSGRVAMRRGSNEEAARQFERALALDPANDQAAYLLAGAYREVGRKDEARRLADRARDGVRPATPPDPYVDRVRAGLHNLQTAVATANQTLAAGNAAAAESMYGAVLAVDPDHFDALYNLGLLYGRQNRFAEAERVLERAVAVRPQDTQSHLLLALALLSQDQLDAGARELRRVLELDPEHMLARRMLTDLEASAAPP